MPADHAEKYAAYVNEHFITSKYADDYTNELMVAERDSGVFDSSLMTMTITNGSHVSMPLRLLALRSETEDSSR